MSDKPKEPRVIAKPVQNFRLDRLNTPIGIALLVTDADGALRALDWEEHGSRMKEYRGSMAGHAKEGGRPPRRGRRWLATSKVISTA
jgi:hypothetical protein